MGIRLHLLLPVVFSMTTIILIIVFKKRLPEKYKILWRGILLFFIIYGIIVGGAFLDDTYLSYQVSKFQNIDGAINYEGLNSQQKHDWDSYISDTGRSFSIFTGLIFSGLITIFYFLVSILKKYLDRNPN